MRSNASRAMFLAYRSGEITFDEVVSSLAPKIAGMAVYFSQRWRCRMLSVNDLRQEIMIGMWRALDTWDPEKGSPIEVHVQIQVGRSVYRSLAKAAGWPRKDRPITIRFVDLEQKHLDLMIEEGEQESVVAMRSLLRKSGDDFLAMASHVYETGEIVSGVRLRAIEISETSDDIDASTVRLANRYRTVARALRADNIDARW